MDRDGWVAREDGPSYLHSHFSISTHMFARLPPKTTDVKYFKEIFAIINIGCPLQRVWDHHGNKALGRSVGRLALNTGEHHLWAGIPEWIKRKM